MPPDDAEMMRAREAGGSDAVRLSQAGQACDRKVDGREGEAVGGIDHQGAGPRLPHARRRMSIDLADAGLRAICRHALEAMALLAVDLGLRESTRHGAGVDLGCSRGFECSGDQRLELG